MNIISTVCWCNVWDKDTTWNVGPDVLCQRNGNAIKFVHMQTKAVSFFKAETVATGLSISCFSGHNRFPLFAFAETVLRPNIYVYRYPDMSRFSSIPPHMVSYTDIRFSELDILVAVGGYPDYCVCVYNYRTGALVLEQVTNVPTVERGIIVGPSNLPAIVQLNKQEMTILGYDICTVEKESFMYKVYEVELGKAFLKSCDRCLTFSEENCLYATNDYGHLLSVDVAGFVLRPQWRPPALEDGSEREMMPRAHGLTYHRSGFIIWNSSSAVYVKKKAGVYKLEWELEGRLNEVVRFLSNINGEIYAERRPGYIDQVMIDRSATASLECVVPTGRPVITFRVLQGLKDECVCALYDDGVAMLDLAKGHTLCEVSVLGASAMANHRSLALVAVGTLDARIVLIHFERASLPHVLCELKLETAAVVGLDFNDSWLVYQDQIKMLHVVQVDTRPHKLTHYFELSQPELAQVFVHTFLLADGPRLMVFINRQHSMKRPGFATELWLYNWGKDKRLHRREYVLPKEYGSFCVQPPVGRWAVIEIVATEYNSFNFDQFALNEKDELQWIASTKSGHFSYILGVGMTKHLVTWSLGGILVHFKQHKRAKKPFMICRFLNIGLQTEFILRVKECFNSKYLLILLANKSLRVMRLPSLADFVRENVALPLPTEEGIACYIEQTIHKVDMFLPLSLRQEVKEEYTRADLLKRDKLFASIKDFAAKVTALIDYDISKTGKTRGIFKKFCFHYPWLDALTTEAHKLCALERESLERAIADQARIRDWILRLVTRDAVSINYRVRSIFADANFESFSVRRKIEMAEFDKYRFYDLEDHMRLSLGSFEEEEPAAPAAGGHGPPPGIEDGDIGEEEEATEVFQGLRELKQFVVEGHSLYEHIMAPVFQLQDKNLVTSNQLFNYNCKIRYYLNDPLKQEFNKLFHEAQQLKQDTIDSVMNTNVVLNKIYDNMNIMLRLLNMEQFVPPELTMPALEQDEVIKRIMEVDDSEIKAINRRKPKTIDTGGKKGRLLLWSTEFWARALIVMMDGVLEKLWEEEIKKDIPEPEFMQKKQPHEYNLEEQKIFRAYEEAVHLLELDRRKYLRILHENEEKTLAQKAAHILKLNQRVAELMITKLKYDFALKQGQLRLLTLEQINFGRVQLRKRFSMFRKDIDKLTEYMTRYGYLLDFYDKAFQDVKTRLEAQQTRDRAVERQFRSQFLPLVPHATHEMTKLFKKRPKLPGKIFNSVLICMEASNKLSGKPSHRTPFPLPDDVLEFLNYLSEFDQPKQCPPQVDAKSWDTFVKLRRQKTESELRLKGIGYQLLDSQAYLSVLNKDLTALKDSKVMTQRNAEESIQTYLEKMRNMTIQLTLTKGQVEVSVLGKFTMLSNTVLMHVDDINNVNQQIQEAGNKKIKAMQRVAVFRRQVIFKEWEHKLYKANIAYLKYMLDAIEKCKVSMEFLNILRNWEKVKTERQKYIGGAIERVIEQKIAAFKKHIDRVNINIDSIKAQTLEVKRSNHGIDFKIERIKVDVTFQNTLRDTMMEDKRDREQRERMAQIKTHRQLMENVRRHYAHVLELQTILELLRLRTYPTLGPPLPQCHPPVPEHILSSVP
uniref:Cilia- and flagella-associated protein 43 n=1 Tax=Drosophila rhopaloa TaxID=1041015 RepID=A0A6P4FEQ1_DRORH